MHGRLLGMLLAGWLILALPASLAAQSVHREAYPNGAVMLVQELRHTHAVAVQLVLRGGPAAEGALLGSGASAVLETLALTAVTERLGSNRGEQVDSQLLHGAIVLTVRAGDDQVERVLNALLAVPADVLRLLEQDEAFDRARQRIQQRHSTQRQDSSLVEMRSIRALMLRHHPGRLPLLGTADGLARLTAAELRQLAKQRLTAPNTLVVIAGNAPVNRIGASARTAVEQLPAGGWEVTPRPVEPTQQAERQLLLRGVLPEARQVVAWRGPAADSRDLAAMVVLAALLDHPWLSPLRAAVEAPGYADRLQARLILEPDLPSHLSLGFRPLPDRSADPWTTVQAVLDRLIADGPDPAALDAVKRALARQSRSDLSRVSGIADDITRWELMLGAPGYAASFRAAIEAVGPEEVKRSVATWVHPAGRNRSTLIFQPGPASTDTAELGAALTDVPPRIEEIAGGLRLVHRYLPLGLVQVRLVIGGGAGVDPDGQSGLAHVLTRLMADGGELRRGDELRRLLSETGMVLEANTSQHAIELGITCFPEDAVRAIELLYDLLRKPVGDGVYLAQRVQDAQTVIGGRLDREIRWDEELMRALRSNLLIGHYAARPPLGDRNGLAELDVAVVSAAHQRLAVSGNVVVAVYGDADTAALSTRLTELTAAHPLAAGVAQRPQGSPWPEVNPAPLTRIAWNREHAGLALAWKGPDQERLAEDGPAVDVLNAVLNAGRLQAALAANPAIRHRGLVMQSEAWIGRGLWTLRLQLDHDGLADATKALSATVRRLVQDLSQTPPEGEDPLARDIAHAKELCITQRRLAQEDQAAVAGRHARSLLLLGGMEQDLAYATRVAAVSREDLRRVAVTYLDAAPWVVELAALSAPPPAETALPVPLVTNPEPSPTAVDETSPEAATPIETLSP